MNISDEHIDEIIHHAEHEELMVLRKEIKQAYANLTATQVRCNELLEETRAQRIRIRELEVENEARGG